MQSSGHRAYLVGVPFVNSVADWTIAACWGVSCANLNRGLQMRRREFIAGLGGAAAWPLAPRAQQPAMPVIGYLSGRSAESDVPMLAAFRRGLNEADYIEGRNLAVEYRFADGQPDRVPALFTELTGRRVAVLVLVGVTFGDDGVSLLRSSQFRSCSSTRRRVSSALALFQATTARAATSRAVAIILVC
jgi:hypothetical protein